MTIKKLFALFFTLMLASTSNSAFAQEVESPKKGKKGIEAESQDDNESATQKQKKQKEVDQDYIDALAAEKEAKRKAKEEEAAKAKKEKKPQPVAEEPIEPAQKKTKKQKEVDQDYLDALAAEKEAKKSGTYKKEEIVAKPEVRQIVPLDLGIAPKPKGKPADPVDRSMKGPTGQTVYTSKLGGKYYINALDKKEFLVPEK